MNFTMEPIYLDANAETERLVAALKDTVAFKLKNAAPLLV